MKITKLQLENFQGIRSAYYRFDGLSASIYGDNATGKTTVFNAITWLLFDKASTGAKNFTPKTKGPEGDLHYLDHAVTARFQMDDGRMLTLRKVFHEIYKKKRGSATEEFDGHSIDYYIDGVPVKEKEYNTTLLNSCGDAEKMKMLTMPSYFAEDMPWDARRKILLEICGDVSDEDVIGASPELRELPGFLQMPGAPDQCYTVEEYKKIAAAKKSDINKQLAALPGRIDEARRAIPEEQIDVAAANAQIAAWQKEIDALTAEKAAILTGDTAAAEARKAIMDAAAQLAEARAAYLTKTALVNEGVNKEIADIQRKVFTARGRVDAAEAAAQQHRRDVRRMEARRAELMEDYNSIMTESWDETQAVCPTCHRDLPEEDISRMREAFNVRRSARLQAINEKGLKEASKEMIEEARTAAVEEEKASLGARSDMEALQKQFDDLQAQVKHTEPFEATEEYAALAASVAACRENEGNAAKTISDQTAAINAKMTALQSEIQTLQQRVGQAAQAEIQQKRIAELMEQEKTLSAEYEELEKGIFLCDLFTKAKVSALTDRINSKFRTVRFRLFVEQINGGLKEDCEVMIPTEDGRMVPYTFANNAARINAGLEIIDALSTHWGITMPVVVDNAESVTRLLPVDMQVIRLVVSEADKALRLELDDNRKAA